MTTNKIIHILISLTALIVVPVQLVTTFVLGLVVSIPLVGFLLLIPISLVWIVLFYGPILGLSYLYEKVSVLKPIVSIVGIPIAVLGDTYVALMPSMGEMDSRYAKMIICQTFPYSWRFNKLQIGKLYIGKDDILHKILVRVSEAKSLRDYLGNLKARLYSHPDYLKVPYDINW